MKIAVVGHLEWCSFVKLDHLPVSGEIAHAKDGWEEVGGGGAVSAMQIKQLNGSCTFFTVVGDDEAGQKSIKMLQDFGIDVKYYVDKNKPTTKTHIELDPSGDRTGDLYGPLKPNAELSPELDWESLADYDAVYFASGDGVALQMASKCPIVVSTARTLDILKMVDFRLSALVMSQNDPAEKYADGDLNQQPELIVKTNGANEGLAIPGGKFTPNKVSKVDFKDTYGCGDSFAGGLTFGLAKYKDITKALKVAVQAGAESAKRDGAFRKKQSKYD